MIKRNHPKAIKKALNLALPMGNVFLNFISSFRLYFLITQGSKNADTNINPINVQFIKNS